MRESTRPLQITGTMPTLTSNPTPLEPGTNMSVRPGIQMAFDHFQMKGQGYRAHQKPRPPMTLQWDHAYVTL